MTTTFSPPINARLAMELLTRLSLTPAPVQLLARDMGISEIRVLELGRDLVRHRIPVRLLTAAYAFVLPEHRRVRIERITERYLRRLERP